MYLIVDECITKSNYYEIEVDQSLVDEINKYITPAYPGTPPITVDELCDLWRFCATDTLGHMTPSDFDRYKYSYDFIEKVYEFTRARSVSRIHEEGTLLSTSSQQKYVIYEKE